jgi:hypothetical protein
MTTHPPRGGFRGCWVFVFNLAVLVGCSSSRSGVPDGGAPACTPSCAGTCTAGKCFVTLSTNTVGGPDQGGSELVLDNTKLYWVENTRNIESVPTAGGATTTLASFTYYPEGLAVDTSHVFWASSSFSLDGGFIESAPTSGGSPATIASGLSNPAAIATDGTNVYFTAATATSYCSAGVTPCTGYVLSMPVGGGTISTLASSPGLGVSLFLAHGQLYWTTGDGRVLTVPTSGGTPRQLAYEVTYGLAVVADQAAAYWTNSAGEVKRLPLDGGKPTVLAAGQTPIAALAVDESSVYWINLSGTCSVPGAPCGVLKVPIDGGPVTVIPSPDGGAFDGLAVDDTSLYLLVQSSSTSIVKVTPK